MIARIPGDLVVKGKLPPRRRCVALRQFLFMKRGHKVLNIFIQDRISLLEKLYAVRSCMVLGIFFMALLSVVGFIGTCENKDYRSIIILLEVIARKFIFHKGGGMPKNGVCCKQAKTFYRKLSPKLVYIYKNIKSNTNILPNFEKILQH